VQNINQIIDIMTKNKKKQNRRYYLHRKIKLYYTVIANRKEVRIPHTDAGNFPSFIEKYMNELISLGYNIQTEI